jgi:hypothetical protein
MTKLFDHAIQIARQLSPIQQDEIAQAILTLAQPKIDGVPEPTPEEMALFPPEVLALIACFNGGV